MRIPFGKFKGLRLDDDEVELGYLVWLQNNCTRLSPAFAYALEKELQRRTWQEPEAPKAQPESRTGGLAKVNAIVTHWYRELSLQFHPDRGGKNDMMKALNIANDRLRELLQAG